jgi:hypothetical protein
MKRWHFVLFFGLILGCGGKEPLSLVEVEGTLLLDDKPLPLALVEFMPELKGHGAEANSTAVTDENGRFKLQKAAVSGAVIATHRIVVNEGPPPAGARGQDEASQAKFTQYMTSLKNRPIPQKYSNFSASTARVEIKGAEKNLIIKLTR